MKCERGGREEKVNQNNNLKGRKGTEKGKNKTESQMHRKE
jgi:hypothetical protein